jgi:hypothetical protein
MYYNPEDLNYICDGTKNIKFRIQSSYLSEGTGNETVQKYNSIHLYANEGGAKAEVKWKTEH